MSSRIIKRYGHLSNVNFTDFVSKKNQRFYRTTCSSCGCDRGYIEPKCFSLVCLSCSKTNHNKEMTNVDYNDFIKQPYCPKKYRMNCIECGKDKGYKPIAYANRRCHDCSNKYISKIKTKISPMHKKVRHAMSVNISCRLNKRGSKKSGNSIFSILGYSFEELIKHLEVQFEPWMNWDNYGIYDPCRKTWHIDHIKPDSSFTYSSYNDQGFKDSWALSNLRPLEAKLNIIKSDSYVED